MTNFGVQILLNQLKSVHNALEGTMEGVTNEVAQFQPEGTANPIAGVYAHLVFSEDLFVSGFLKQTPPLCDSTFKDKTGSSALHPTEWQVEYPKWLREVKVDIENFREYAKAVYAQTEEYLSGLNDEDLEKDIDMSSFGMGVMKQSAFIAEILSGHAYSIMGEISVLKGIQGLKGYPF